ncbi:MAG: DnaA/Hda family protein [Leptospiraceae bacterium]|nr:DnaA/Hda family protein [Leptospiraceae bacterium]
MDWDLVLQEISKKIPDTYYKPFILPLTFEEMNDQVVILKAPSEIIKSHVENKYQKFIEEALETVSGDKFRIEINVDEGTKPIATFLQDKFKDESFEFNPEYTLDQFIFSEMNKPLEIACSMILQKNTSSSFNPFYIYGNIGVGKTHLLHALGAGLEKIYQSKSIKYISINTFLSEFVINVQNRQNLDSFRNKYQSYSVLIVDDMQYLTSIAEKTQDEFYNLFNFLFERKRQIILAADKPIADLSIQERLKSRFMSGTQVEILDPDSKLREEIISKKSQQLGLNLDPCSVTYISENFKSDIRAMTGCLNELSLYKNAYNLLILTDEKIREILRTRIEKVDKHENQSDNILNHICQYYSQEKSAILGKSRRSEYIMPRHVSMYLLYEICRMNKSQIGKMFNTSHQTVLSAIEKIELKLKNEEKFKRNIDSFRKKFELQ